MGSKLSFHIVRNESGVGIIQMLILVAVSGALIAAIATAMVTMVRSQQTVAQSIEADLWADQVTQLLSNDQLCSTTMTPFLANLNGAPQGLAFSLPLSTGSVFMNVGTVISDNFEILDVSNKVDTAVPSVTIISGATTLRTYESVLSVQLKKRNLSTFVQTMKPFEVRVQLVVNASDQAVGCAAASGGSMACKAEGGVWNPLAPDGQKCVSVKYCAYGGSYSEKDVDGGFINTYTNGRSCPTGFSPQQSGTINRAFSTGKYTVGNDPTRIMTCMRCGTQVQATAPAPSGPFEFSGNQTALDEAANSAGNDYNLANADTIIAYNNWQAGVTQKNNAQTNLSNAQNYQSSVSGNITYYQQSVANEQSNLTSAQSNYNAAVAADSAGSTAATQAAVVSAQNSVNSAQSALNSANSNLSYWQGQQTPAAQGVSSATTAKQNADVNEQNLYQIYLGYKQTSDNLLIVWQNAQQEASSYLAAHPPP